MNNHHKTKNCRGSSGNQTTKGSETIERGYFNNFSYFYVLWTKCKHLLCEISYSEQYYIKKYHAFCMISLILFKLLTFTQILQGVHKLLSADLGCFSDRKLRL